jgi:hypothetical protein
MVSSETHDLSTSFSSLLSGTLSLPVWFTFVLHFASGTPGGYFVALTFRNQHQLTASASWQWEYHGYSPSRDNGIVYHDYDHASFAVARTFNGLIWYTGWTLLFPHGPFHSCRPQCWQPLVRTTEVTTSSMAITSSQSDHEAFSCSVAFDQGGNILEVRSNAMDRQN